MGIFSKKKSTAAAPLDAQPYADTVRPDQLAVDDRAANPFNAPVAAERMTYDGQPGVMSHGQPVVTPHGQPVVAPHGQPVVTPHGQPVVAPHGQPVVAPHGQTVVTAPAASTSHSMTDKLHTVKGTTVSGVAVTFLILWTIAVAGWTGFQVVQNALVWSRLQNQPFSRPPNAQIPNNGYQGIDRLELKALWAIVAIESGLVVFFVALAIALMWVPCISACRQHKVARRTKRSFLPWFITLVLVASAWFKLFTLSSVLNKMSYQNTWCATGENLDIKYTFDSRGQPPPPANCQPSSAVGEIRRTMVYAMLTVAFHLLVYFAHQPRGLFGKIFGFIPVVIIVALLVLKPLTSMMNWYYTQNYFINRSLPGPPAGLKQGNFTFTSELIVALIEFITAVWLSLYMGWAVHALRLVPRLTNTLLGCCGKRYDDVYYENDETSVARHADAKAATIEEGGTPAVRGRKSYHLRAAAKSVVQQFYYMTQLPSVFGFVSPMITYFALGVTNWWIVFDIIVGAALIFIYIVLCAFHRKILSPPKA